MSLVEDSLEYLEFPILYSIFFNTPVTYFLKYFRAKFRQMLMSGSLEIGVYYACAAFNLVLSVIKKELRIAGFFASLPFLTYVCNKRLRPSIHCVHYEEK